MECCSVYRVAHYAHLRGVALKSHYLHLVDYYGVSTYSESLRILLVIYVLEEDLGDRKHF